MTETEARELEKLRRHYLEETRSAVALWRENPELKTLELPITAAIELARLLETWRAPAEETSEAAEGRRAASIRAALEDGPEGRPETPEEDAMAAARALMMAAGEVLAEGAAERGEEIGGLASAMAALEE